MAKGMALGFLGSLAVCLLLAALRPWAALDPRLRVGAADDPRNLPLLFVLLWCGSLFAAPVQAQVSQFMERQSDRAALDLTATDVYATADGRSRRPTAGTCSAPFRVFWLHLPASLDRVAWPRRGGRDGRQP
jgi:Zn-dependent protease with chaperone function